MGSFGGDELSEWEIQSPGPPGSAPRARGERIQVSVRVRPLNEKEVATNDFADWECIDSNTVVFKNVVGERTMYPNAYMYDRVYGPNSSTREIYDEAAKEVALSVVNGINSSIFAYGQTSSGKTFTMAGITQYTIEDIFGYIEKHEGREFVLKFSALEIYNEAVRDLLSEDTTPLRLLDDPEKGTVVERLTEETLRDKSHLLELISVCEAQRQIGETALNETSSRSHQILRLTVESSVCQLVGTANSSTLSATVNCVDLAGSERTSHSAGTRLKEGCHINRSLLTLGTVIRKLSKGRNGHIPYRDSKLTRILQNSLGGNARTAIICTMSPAHSHVEQSRNTLLFATCAKEVCTNARVNVVMTDKELVKQLRRELARLEGELGNMSPGTCKGDNPAQLREKEQQIEKMDKEIKELSSQRDLAQARIEELLLSTGQQEASTKQSKTSWLNDSSMGSDYQHLDMGLKTSDAANYLREQSEIDLNKIALLDDSEGQFLTDDTSPQFPDEPPELFGPGSGYEKFLQGTLGDAEDNCKEVRCIEVEEAMINNKNETRVMTNPFDDDKTEEKSANREILIVPENEFEIVPPRKAEMEPIPSAAEYNAMVNRIRELQRTIDNLVNRCPEGDSPFPTKSETLSARDLILSRSRSCREVTTSFPGYEYGGQKLDLLFDGLERQSLGRPKSLPGPSTLNSTNSPRMNLTSIGNAFLSETGQEIKTSSNQQEESDETVKDDTSNDQKSDEQPPSDWNQEFMRQNLRLEKNPKDELALNVEQGTSASSPCWLQDFEQQQQQIIKLWDSCHSSLVHRSYFFSLFREANPSDSIYMEVELRRLSFIQSKFSQGAKITMDGQILTPSSSMRDLNHEREMLSRQMQKKLTSKEREELFRKWGIGIHTKRRRLQLARRLWTDPNDMENVRESAALVAKLNGFTNGGQIPKEMFVGPSFASKSLSKKSYSWRNSLSSLV